MKTTAIICFLSGLLFLGSCKYQFEPISYGHDGCAACKMTIMDKRYAAEILTKKGKAFKFDDITCLKKHILDEHLAEADLEAFVADYANPDNKFLDAFKAVYLTDPMFKSPMSGNFAAFAEPENAQQLMDSLQIKLLKWENVN